MSQLALSSIPSSIYGKIYCNIQTQGWIKDSFWITLAFS